MDVGKLRSRVLLQYRPSGGSRTPSGQPTGGWVNLITAGDGKVWANIRHLSGVEAIRAGADKAIGKASIRIRRRSDVTEKMRVIHGSVTYQIEAVLPDEVERDYMDLACVKVV